MKIPAGYKNSFHSYTNEESAKRYAEKLKNTGCLTKIVQKATDEFLVVYKEIKKK